jgi:hypothetical protein
MRNVDGTGPRVWVAEYITCLDDRYVLVRESQPPEPRELFGSESDDDFVKLSDRERRTDSVGLEEVDSVWYTSNAFQNLE